MQFDADVVVSLATADQLSAPPSPKPLYIARKRHDAEEDSDCYSSDFELSEEATLLQKALFMSPYKHPPQSEAAIGDDASDTSHNSTYRVIQPTERSSIVAHRSSPSSDPNDLISEV